MPRVLVHVLHAVLHVVVVVADVVVDVVVVVVALVDDVAGAGSAALGRCSRLWTRTRVDT
jgi:hypothetical protein